MPPKDLGPLLSAQKEADVLKKKVAQVIKESNKTLDNRKLKDKEEKLKELYKNCLDVKQEVTVLLEKVKSLTEDQEPKKLKRYVAMKNQEVNRIDVWQNQLTNTMSKLLPNEIEEEYLKKLKKETEEGSEDAEDKEDDEEEEDDEDDDEEEEEEQQQKNKKQEPTASPSQQKAKAKEEEEEEEEEEDDEEEDDEDEEGSEEEEPEKKPHPKEKEKVVSEKGKPDAKVEEDEEEEESVEDEEESVEEEESEEEEDEEEEEEDETASGEEGEEDVQGVSQQLNQFIATAPFMKEQDGDLGFVKGDILNIIEMKGDWWIGENDKGERGNVPANLLQKYNKYITIQKDDAEEEEEEEEEEAGDGDTYPRKKRHGKALWGSIKKAVTETTVSDVLHAMGAVPSGFRMSTLSKYFNESDTYRMINYLNPKLSVSNLMYKDLFFDPLTSKIRPRKVKIERIVTLVSCQQIPHPGSGIKLLSRHVRICLFDGQNILSNIHTVKVSDKNLEERTWLFSTRIFERMNISEHGETFIRTNSIVDNIGILFELGISYIRESTEQKDEFSCGWVHLPLLDQDGTFVANRTFNLYVNGGTPYEKGVEVDPSISRRTSTNAFVSLISGNKQPRLVVRISLPKTEQKAQLDSLPDILVGNVALLPFYSYFRQIMADVLLRDRIDLDSTELVHSPLLANFPNVADQPDLMKVLRDAWIERLKTVERSQKRDEEFMKNLFKQVFMESVYPVVHTVLLPKYKTGDTDTEQKRHEQICHFDQIKRDRKSALAALLSSEMVFTPFNIKEVSFNVVGAHCMLKHTHTASVEG